jgi:teichuronic acid biosynthesis glycosyltransferase TuaC
MYSILFVFSSNSSEIAPFIKAQAASLEQQGVKVDYLGIKGRLLWGYPKAIFQIHKRVNQKNPDVVHAHFVLSAWAAVLAFTKKPLVLSLMGTDAYGVYVGKEKIKFFSRMFTMLTYLIQPFLHHIICKSAFIQSYVYRKSRSSVIPNGVNTHQFVFQQNARDELGLDIGKNYLLFLGNKNIKRKNFDAVQKAYELICDKNVELIAPYPVTHNQVVAYLSAANVLVAPSFMEGSPNVVKEAMLCNCPVVATDVGDIKWLFGNEPGHFISDFSPDDLAEKILLAFDYSRQHQRTNGRKRIMDLGLDSASVAKQLISLYEKLIE